MLVHVIEMVKSFDQVDSNSTEADRPLSETLAALWQRLAIEIAIRQALGYEGDPRIHAAALSCLRQTVALMPEGIAEQQLDDNTLLLLHQIAAEGKADVWVQCEALASVYSLSKTQALPLLQRRLAGPLDGDDMFVRRRILQILEQDLLAGNHVDIQLPPSDDEPSPFVRQKMAKVAFLLREQDAGERWSKFALSDDAPQVRAAALLAGIEVQCNVSDTVDFLEVVERGHRTGRATAEEAIDDSRFLPTAD